MSVPESYLESAFSGSIYTGMLHLEVLAAGLSQTLDGVTRQNGYVKFLFPLALSSGDKTLLDAVVAAHPASTPSTSQSSMSSSLVLYEGYASLGTSSSSFVTIGRTLWVPSLQIHSGIRNVYIDVTGDQGTETGEVDLIRDSDSYQLGMLSFDGSQGDFNTVKSFSIEDPLVSDLLRLRIRRTSGQGNSGVYVRSASLVTEV